MTPETLAEYRAYADQCSDPPGIRTSRPRCASCAKILTLIAHIRLLERRLSSSPPEGEDTQRLGEAEHV